MKYKNLLMPLLSCVMATSSIFASDDGVPALTSSSASSTEAEHISRLRSCLSKNNIPGVMDFGADLDGLMTQHTTTRFTPALTQAVIRASSYTEIPEAPLTILMSLLADSTNEKIPGVTQTFDRIVNTFNLQPQSFRAEHLVHTLTQTNPEDYDNLVATAVRLNNLTQNEIDPVEILNHLNYAGKDLWAKIEESVNIKITPHTNDKYNILYDICYNGKYN